MNKAALVGVLMLTPLLFLNGCSQNPQGQATPNPGDVMATPMQPPPPPPPPPDMTPGTPGETGTPGAETGTPSAGETPGGAVSMADIKTVPLKGKGLTPLPGVKDAPKLTKMVNVKFKTDKGDIFMEVYPEAAPNHAARFLELVKSGFYDNTPVFRVVPGFVAQFGLNSKKGEQASIPDDPSYYVMEKGVLAFAKSGMPDSASSQIFICYNDVTSSLVPEPGGKGVGIFTAFGKVTKGMDLAEKFKAVGDPQMGLDQGALGKDTEGYLKGLPAEQKPDMIIKAEIVK